MFLQQCVKHIMAQQSKRSPPAPHTQRQEDRPIVSSLVMDLTMPDSEATRFLNVDLELVATFDLTPLLEHFNRTTFTLRDSVDDGRRTVWMELDADPKDTDDALLRYAMLVESLPSDIRGLWDECEDRCLNVGIQSGLAPHASAFRISTAALAKLVAIAARLVITVYSVDGEKTKRSRPRAT